MPTITKYNFTGTSEDILLGTNSETIGDGTLFGGTNFALNPTVTLSDGSVVKVIGSGSTGYLQDTLGAAVTSVTDNSSHNDVIYGNTLNDTFTMSGSGYYTIHGGNGTNTFNVAGSGNTKVYTGNGSDTINLTGNGTYTVFGQNSSDKITLSGDGADTVYGGNSGDKITITSAADGYDTVLGGNGKDTLDASASTNHDTLYAGNGTDVVYASAAGDLVIGGLGGDVLYSQAGVGNTFAYFTNTSSQASDSPFVAGGPGTIPLNPLTWGHTWDVIVNFDGCSQGGNDVLDFANAHNQVAGLNVDNSATTNLVNAETGPGWVGGFVWLGNQGSDADAGTVNPGHAHAVWQDSGDNFVYADINGDGKADLKIQVGEKLDVCDFNGVTTDSGPTVTVDGTLTLDEETDKGFAIGVTLPNAGDSLDHVTITGVPDGATLTSATDQAGITNNGDGSWTIAPGALSDLTFVADEQVTTTLHVTATDIYNVTSADHTVALTINPVADPADLAGTLGTAGGDEDSAIALTIVATPVEDDQSVSSIAITVTSSDIPGGVTLSSDMGTVVHELDGSWTVSPDALPDLKVSGEDGTATLHVVVTTADGTATNSDANTDITVTINPVAEPPALTINGDAIVDNTGNSFGADSNSDDTVLGAGTVNVPTDFHLGVTPQDGDDTVSVTISDVEHPHAFSTDGVHLDGWASLGGIDGSQETLNSDGSITLTGDLSGLTITATQTTDDHLKVDAQNTAEGGDTIGYMHWPVTSPSPIAGDDNWVVSNATKFTVPVDWMTWNDGPVGDGLSVTGVSGLPSSWHAEFSGGELTLINVDSTTQQDFSFTYTLHDATTDGDATGTVNMEILQPTGDGTVYDLSGLTYDHSFIDMKQGDDTGTGGTAQVNNIIGGFGADTIYGADGTPDNFIYEGTSDSAATYHANGNNEGLIEHEGRDSIYNFNPTDGDKIDLTALGSLISSDDLGVGATTIAAGSFGWKTDGTNTDLYVNTSNHAETITDGATYNVDMEIHLVGNPAISAGDILHA